MAIIDNLGQGRYSVHVNVHLTAELKQLVQSRVQSGRYSSASEVVREALRLLEQRDEVFALRKEEIRKKISAGWDAARRGEFVDGDEIFDRVESELKAHKRSSRK